MYVRGCVKSAVVFAARHVNIDKSCPRFLLHKNTSFYDGPLLPTKIPILIESCFRGQESYATHVGDAPAAAALQTR